MPGTPTPLDDSPATPTRAVRPSTRIVVAVVAAVALLDAATGLWLLLSSRPWLAHGPGTLWVRAGEALRPGDPVAEAALSLWRRVGAFSLLAGATSLAWLRFALRDRAQLSTLLVLYTVVGPAFFVSDARYFAGTPYFVVKQVISVAWTAALVLHFVTARTARAP